MMIYRFRDWYGWIFAPSARRVDMQLFREYWYARQQTRVAMCLWRAIWRRVSNGETCRRNVPSWLPLDYLLYCPILGASSLQVDSGICGSRVSSVAIQIELASFASVALDIYSGIFLLSPPTCFGIRGQKACITSENPRWTLSSLGFFRTLLLRLK